MLQVRNTVESILLYSSLWAERMIVCLISILARATLTIETLERENTALQADLVNSRMYQIVAEASAREAEDRINALSAAVKEKDALLDAFSQTLGRLYAPYQGFCDIINEMARLLGQDSTNSNWSPSTDCIKNYGSELRMLMENFHAYEAVVNSVFVPEEQERKQGSCCWEDGPVEGQNDDDNETAGMDLDGDDDENEDEDPNEKELGGDADVAEEGASASSGSETSSASDPASEGASAGSGNSQSALSNDSGVEGSSSANSGNGNGNERRKRGAQPGHKGASMRKFTTQITETKDYYPEECLKCPSFADCQRENMFKHKNKSVGYDMQFIVTATSYREACVTCPRTHEKLRGAKPSWIKGTRFYGSGVRAGAVVLTDWMCVSMGNTMELFRDGLGIPISTGTVQNFRRQAAELGEPHIDFIRNEIRNSHVVGFDETTRMMVKTGIEEARREYAATHQVLTEGKRPSSPYQIVPKVPQDDAQTPGTAPQVAGNALGTAQQTQSAASQDTESGCDVGDSDEEGSNSKGKGKDGKEEKVGKIWDHVARTDLFTLHTLSCYRGWKGMNEGGILPNFKNIAMTDSLGAYNGYTEATHALCGAHRDRDIAKLKKLDPAQTWLSDLETLFKDMRASKEKISNEYYRGVENGTIQPRDDGPQASQADIDIFSSRYDEIVAAGRRANPNSFVPPALQPKRGRRKKTPFANLLDRLENQKDAWLLFYTDFRVPYSNNGSERDLRDDKIHDTVSKCLRAMPRARDQASNMSIMSSARKHGLSPIKVMRDVFDGKKVNTYQ